MRRATGADNSQAVSLFPFLAVLLCTMGSLIVLLVAMARQARSQATSSADDAQPSSIVDKADVEVTNIVTEETEQKKRAEMLAKLETLRTDIAQQLEDDRMRLQHWEDHIRRLTQRLVELQRQAQQLDEQKQQVSIDREQAKSEKDRLAKMVEKMRQELEKARDKAAHRPKSYAIIPYQGKNKTYRRPLFIECRRSTVVLQPEGIELAASDFDDPMGPDNPLASALRAACEYYARTDEQQEGHNAKVEEDVDQPYPLLLVRPDGIENYYGARKAIESWNNQFGYEMIDEDWQLEFPPPDPELAAVEYRAVQLARAMRKELEKSMAVRRGPIYRASPHRGGFVREGGAMENKNWDAANHDRSPVGTSTAGHPGDEKDDSRATGGGPFADRSDTADQSAVPSRAQASGGDVAGGAPVGSPNGDSQRLAIKRGRNWALPDASRSAVPISRPVHVVCRADRFIVLPRGRWDAQADVTHNTAHDDNGQVVSISGSTDDAIDDLVSAIWEHMATWGIAGQGFYWRPLLVLHAGPDGRQRADEVRVLLDDSGLETVDNELHTTNGKSEPMENKGDPVDGKENSPHDRGHGT